jgi:F-type H+-transporting ATPase subunit gamma
MPSLKSLRLRINSVKQTRKITSAMKMVAAAKLRRAQEQAEAARPFAERMEAVLRALSASMKGRPGAPAMMAGTGKADTHLVLVMTADRGLCGSFNSSVVRESRRLIRELTAAGRIVRIFCVGRKGRDQLRREFGDNIIETIQDWARPRVTYEKAEAIARRVTAMFQAGEFDAATIVYNRYRSPIVQVVMRQQLIPFAAPEAKDAAPAEAGTPAVYEFEPEEDEILADLLPRNLAVQVYRALLESNAGFQGAQMTAMDNATRNAGDMLNRLTLHYNRTRQAAITRELIEIISGAEAV